MPVLEHTLKSLKSDLRRMGVGAGDILIVHSSMKSLGPVRGGPGTVIRALQQAVSPRGTLLMPTFTYCAERVYSRAEPYDPASSPSQTGLLTETFRKMPAVFRSGHPTHSVAAWGRQAREFTEGHERIGGLAAGSPFGRAAQSGAKLCMIGCDFTALSLLHVAEEIAEAPYLKIFAWWHTGRLPVALLKSGTRTVRISYPTVPGCSGNFGLAEALARKKGLVRECRLGNARVLMADGRAVLKQAADAVRRQPDFLLCQAGECRVCDERRTIFEIARSPGASLAGDVIIEIVNRAGNRLAGGPGERKAAEIIAERMGGLGLAGVSIHEFPIVAWRPGFGALQVAVNGAWKPVPAAPASHAPATAAGPITGATVNVESMADLRKARASGATVAVLWDGYGNTAEDFRALMKAGFSASIFVDKRFTDNDHHAIGVPGQWLGLFTRPMVSVPFPDAVRHFGGRSVRCRLSVAGRNVPGKSTVVTGEIRGAGPGVILVGSHHDSTFNSVAVDDNLTGVAAMFVMAERLRNAGRLRHTIRFCSFGGEEQLSEGARWYALESGLARDVRFVLNNDSLGTRAGTTNVLTVGPAAMTKWLRRETAWTSLQFKMTEELNPFSDQFPFNVLGVPSLWFYRQNIATGRHFHHTVSDSLAEISLEHVARLAEFQAGVLAKLARAANFPFPPALTAKQLAAAKAAGRQWLGRR